LPIKEPPFLPDIHVFAECAADQGKLLVADDLALFLFQESGQRHARLLVQIAKPLAFHYRCLYLGEVFFEGDQAVQIDILGVSSGDDLL